MTIRPRPHRWTPSPADPGYGLCCNLPAGNRIHMGTGPKPAEPTRNLHLTSSQLDTLFEALALLDADAEDLSWAEEQAVKRRTETVARRLINYRNARSHIAKE